MRSFFVRSFLFAVFTLLASASQATAVLNLNALHLVAQDVLNELQPRSIREGVEYCGAIGYDAYHDEFVVFEASRGQVHKCDFLVPAFNEIEIVASYHTHGNYNTLYDSELPSPEDYYGDKESGTYGYVATPGGRLWFINPKTRSVMLICQNGCIISDRFFAPHVERPIRSFYTIEDLEKRFHEN